MQFVTWYLLILTLSQASGGIINLGLTGQYCKFINVLGD